MQNFNLWIPTKILFGKGKIAELRQELPRGAKILLAFGGGSIKKNGVYEQVRSVLSGFSFLEFSGIEPNPKYETLMKAVELVKREKIDFILAVGGGSVVDGIKFVAAAARYPEGQDPWQFFIGGPAPSSALPFGVVLTLPATGSEMNTGSVVTREGVKRAFLSPHVFPRFSVLDPTVTFSLPPTQVANGVVDAFCHVLEQYLTFPVGANLQDRFAEGILQTLIEVGPITFREPTNYDARATMMWAATNALNGLIGAGVPHDWTTHMIGHELTAKYGIDHGRTLAIVFPATLRVMQTEKREKLLQYGQRVWGISQGSEAARIELAIAKTEDFFQSLGVETQLGKYGVSREDIPVIVKNLVSNGMIALGEHGKVTPEVSKRILETSYA